ncbi:MAG: beta/gamma crystallin-related protein [Casimicrobiaceae bacterium]
MHARIHTLIGISLAAAVTAASAQVTFSAQEGFRGQAFTTERPVTNLERFGFNDAASSAVVTRGRWEVCTDEGFGGECRVLQKGSYDSLRGMGIGKRISSVRPLKGEGKVAYAPPPLPEPTYAYRQRPNERLYQVPVTAAQAVYGAPEQRCWVEREQVQSQGNVNVPGAIIGGILGGVLGHQVGGGRGKDVATGVGAVGGAVVGANVGSSGGNTYGRDVQRCSTTPAAAAPAYWDVSYDFRGQPHRVQLATPPGPTITVNEKGEPRG